MSAQAASDTADNDNGLADKVAQCVLEAYDRLPASRKPRGPGSGLGEDRREWVPLAGIVMQGMLGSSAVMETSCG